MTVKQAAARLDVSPSLIYALLKEGRIEHTRFGREGRRGTIRISEEALEEYRASRLQTTQCTTATGEAP